MKSKILLLALLVLLTGCGLPFNRPAVGPDGTIALFLDEEGAYNLLPSGATLALAEGGALTRLEGVTTAGDAGALTWSPDGKELVYLETESGSWGLPISWTLWLTSIETDSRPVTLLHSEEAIIDPAFTPEGDITYLRVDEGATGHLMCYSRATDAHTQLLEGVLSYRPTRSGSTLTIIRGDDEGALRTAHVSTYDPATGRIEEIASFFLGGEMEETLLLFPAPFLWDIDSSGRRLALALFDQVLITPEVEVDGPSLYLIDVEQEMAERLTTRGVAPTFSPDGTLLAYIGSIEEDTNAAFLFDLETWSTRRVRGSEGAAALFWIDQETLGLAVESEDETYRLVVYFLGTGEFRPAWR
jgi:Tol biopolymer transport system component